MLKVSTTFNFGAVAKQIEEATQKAQVALIEKLKKVARAQVKMAKSVRPPTGYYDDTGDLSSSKGAMIFVEGNEVYSYFTLTDQGTNGIKEGRKLAREVGSSTTGIVLVIVAGAFYARYVEAKGYDVISGTSDYLVDMLREELKR